MQKVDWFSRGRDAFTEGKPCFCQDARISGADRNAWYEGWKHQQRLNGSPRLQAEVNEAVEGIQEILTALRAMP